MQSLRIAWKEHVHAPRRARRALAIATLAALLVALLVMAVPRIAGATARPATFIAVLQGRNEVPGPGDPDAFAVAFVRSERLLYQPAQRRVPGRRHPGTAAPLSALRSGPSAQP